MSMIIPENDIAAGVHDFKIMRATDEVSKAGNKMIKCVLNVKGETFWYYLLPKRKDLIKIFLLSIGREDIWNSKLIDPKELEGHEGKCIIDMVTKRDGGADQLDVTGFILKNKGEKSNDEPSF